MVVKYDYCTYGDKYSGIDVDATKDCDKATCEISPTGYEFSSTVLRNQYNSIMHTEISDSDFEKLEQQVKEYISTGDVPEDSHLSNYIKQWNE